MEIDNCGDGEGGGGHGGGSGDGRHTVGSRDKDGIIECFIGEVTSGVL